MKALLKLKNRIIILLLVGGYILGCIHFSSVSSRAESVTQPVQVNQDTGNAEDETEYFRPSSLPILNDKKIIGEHFSDYYGKDTTDIIVPKLLLANPEETIINYFSTLRNAANPVEGKITGCGTIGQGKIPYPISYEFLSTDYQETLGYEDYLKLYENILHLNLIKLREVPSTPNEIQYFIEFETIEGSEKGIGYFAYYYGYIRLINENGNYKISDIDFDGEDYLCAPYHGWDYMAENLVDVKYGTWCSLIKERYDTEKDGYVKKVYFKGTDNHDYLILFYQLTNGKDVEIAQYKKDNKGEWQFINLNEDCLNNDKGVTTTFSMFNS